MAAINRVTPAKPKNQEKDETKFQVKLKRVLQKTEAGFLLVNKTDQARAQRYQMIIYQYMISGYVTPYAVIDTPRK